MVISDSVIVINSTDLMIMLLTRDGAWHSHLAVLMTLMVAERLDPLSYLLLSECAPSASPLPSISVIISEVPVDQPVNQPVSL